MKIKRLLLAAMAVTLLAQAQLVGAKTFRYATTGDILGLDPHANNEGPTNTMKGNIYGRLIHRKPDLSLVPDLATKWERTGDTAWRFTLRQGVTFHNGNAFNADDVVYSFKRQTQESSEMSFALASVENLVKIDDYTVEITTKGPDPILLLNMPNFYIVDMEFMEQAMEDGKSARPLIERHPELDELAKKVIGLYHEIMTKALENEKKA